MLMSKGRLCRIRNGNKIFLDHTNNTEYRRSNDVLHLLREYLLHHLLLVPLLPLIMLPCLHLLYITKFQTRRVRRLRIQIRHRGVMIIHMFIRIHIRNHLTRGVLRLLISSWMGGGGDLLLRLLPLVGVGVNLDLLGI